MQLIDEIINLLADTLHLGERKQRLNAGTPLLGSLPELDSMAVMNIITGLEEHFGITIDDDDISAQTFESVGTLAAFVDRKLAT
jgi:acyl carrier protein